jgi:hypothetical protein
MTVMPGHHPGQLPAGGAAPTPDPAARYVGQYAYSYSSTTSANVTINSADLTLAGVNKQLVIAWAVEAPIPSGVTINGVRAVLLCVDGSGFVELWAGPRVGTGNITITVMVGSAATEVGAIQVWEVVNAAPLHEGFAQPTTLPLLAPVAARFAPKGSITFAAGFNPTDTVTATWTGVTEDADADVGDFRLTSAHSPSSLAGDTRDSITLTWASGTGRLVLANAIRGDVDCVRGGMVLQSNFSASFSNVITFSRPDLVDHTNAGAFKLVLFVTTENTNNTTIAGVTFDGNAMTLLGSVFNTTAEPDLRIYAYAIDVTQADPSGSLVITLSAAELSLAVGVVMMRLYGVGSVGTPGSVQGDTTGASFPVNVAEGGLIVALSLRGTDTQTTTWTGVTEVEDIDNGSYARSVGLRWDCGAETGRIIQATGSAAGQYATLAIPFNP